MNKRTIWKVWEDLVVDYYRSRWFSLIAQNYTIRWWELDIILENKEILVFVEVKVVDNIDDLYWYITKNKLNYLKKTIQYFLLEHNNNKSYRVDFAFVKDWKIIELYENQFI